MQAFTEISSFESLKDIAQGDGCSGTCGMDMNKQNWWMKVSIALAAPLLAGTYEERAGAGAMGG